MRDWSQPTLCAVVRGLSIGGCDATARSRAAASCSSLIIPRACSIANVASFLSSAGPPLRGAPLSTTATPVTVVRARVRGVASRRCRLHARLRDRMGAQTLRLC